MDHALWYLIFMGTFGLFMVCLGCVAFPLLALIVNWWNPRRRTTRTTQEQNDRNDSKLQYLLALVKEHSKCLPTVGGSEEEEEETTTTATMKVPSSSQECSTLEDDTTTEEEGKQPPDSDNNHDTVVVDGRGQDNKKKKTTTTTTAALDRGNTSSSDDDDFLITNNNKNRRYVSNGCAICLEEYEGGESIIGSILVGGNNGSCSSFLCNHIFHEQCMKSFITTRARKGDYIIPCPCCRQDFFSNVTPPNWANPIPTTTTTTASSLGTTMNDADTDNADIESNRSNGSAVAADVVVIDENC